MKRTALFTFFLDFAGGTYISQVEADSPESAMVAWAKQLDASKIEGMGPATKDRIIQMIESEGYVNITGMQNVWCFDLMPLGKFMIIHFTKTDASVASK